MSSAEPAPGIYKHSKTGALYRLLFTATVWRDLLGVGPVKFLFMAKLSESEYPGSDALCYMQLGTGYLGLVPYKKEKGYQLVGDKMAVYASLRKGVIWARPLGMWSEIVEIGAGTGAPRFTKEME